MNKFLQKSHSPRRIIAIGRGEILVAVFDRLKNIYSTEFDHFVHIGGSNADLNMSCLLRMSKKKGRSGHLMEEDYFSGAASKLIASSSLDKSILVGLDNLQRGAEEFRYNPHPIEGFHDSQHYYHIVVDVLANILLRERIDLAIFFNIPHLFYDTLLYQVAKVLNIETLILSPSNFPNLYYSLRTIEDCGNLPPLPQGQFLEPMAIDSNETPNWHYMKSIAQERGELGHLSIMRIIHLFVYLLTRSPQKLLQPLYIFRLVKRMSHISSVFPKWRDPFADFFHVKHLVYFETLAEFESDKINMDQKFVYFPLQLQPELTTSSFGGRYADQALAIEQLACIVPDDCLIYVKENPKQTGKMRGTIFFHRLRRIRNIRLLPSYANTHELTDRAEFVATVSGTVGWEAICKGKNTLVFGTPWYRSFPGVVVYRDGLKFEDICNMTFDHHQLEQHYSWLRLRLHHGVIGRLSDQETDNFNLDSNAQIVAGKRSVVPGRSIVVSDFTLPHEPVLWKLKQKWIE